MASEESGVDDAAALRIWHAQIADRVSDQARVDAVVATGLLDTHREESFDRITSLAAAVLGVAGSFLTIVDQHRSFWKSAAGPGSTGATENPVSESFCQYVIATARPFAVADARLDDRTRDNSSIESMGVIAWAGCPIQDAEGQVLGTLCAVHTEAREWSRADMALLETLAGAAASEIQLRTALALSSAAGRQLRVELAERDQIVIRSRLLADLSQALSAAGSARDVAEIVTTAGRFALAAEFTNVAVLEASEGTLRIVHSPPLPAEIADRYSIVRLTDDTPLSDAVNTRAPVLIANLDELAQRYPNMVADTIAAGLHATASFPLLRSDRTVAGGLGIGWAHPVEFTPIVQSLLTTVVEMCAQALDRSLVGDARNQFLRSLQQALLPTIPTRQGLEISAEYLPANTELGFGGDWYDVIAISPTRTALIVGDVCGHGIEAAATMTQIRGAINSLVRLRSERLDVLFDDVETVLAREEPLFVATVSVYIIDVDVRQITYVSAGHPPAIMMDRHGNSALLEGGRRPVLGIGGPSPEPATAPFAAGSILVAYTDGLVEHDRHDVDSGIDALLNVLTPIRQNTTQMIANAVARSIHQAHDDIAFTVVRATDT